MHENLELAEKMYEKRLELLVEDKMRIFPQAQLASFMTGGQMQALIANEVNQANKEHNELSAARMIRTLQQEKILTLEAMNDKLNSDLQGLKSRVQSFPTNFGEDWKLVFDFFVRNTKPANPPKV